MTAQPGSAMQSISPSASLEVGLPAGEAGGHALLGILGATHALHQLVDVLVPNGVAERHFAHDQRLYGLEREWRVGAKALNHVAGDGLEVVGVGNVRDDAE